MHLFKKEEKNNYLFNYLDEVGNYKFDEIKFNVIDSLILSILSYFRFDFMMNKANKTLTLKEASDIFFLHEELVSYTANKPYKNTLLKYLAKTNRFKDLILFNYRHDLNPIIDRQFGAISILLDKKTVFISFRGTDLTLVGVKEDLNMSFQKIISSQISAENYFNLKMYRSFKSIYLGGHSKGGNLAIYSYINASTTLKKKTKLVFNFDGPGVFDIENESDLDKIVTIVPEMSIIGMILNKRENAIVIDSDAFGIEQHNPFTWTIKNKRFVLSTYISRTSQIFNESFKQYFLGLDKKSREDFITILWELVSSTNAKTILELKKDIPKQLLKIYDSYKLLDDNEKTLFKRHALYIVKLFIHSIRYFENYKEEVPLNDIKNLYELY